MIFKVKNGCYGYNINDLILKDINFSVKQGEVVTVLGQNGIGKTTLLKCMMGLLKWKKGESYIDDIPITKIKQKDLFKNIAYVPQAKATVYSYNALDMVVFGRSSHISMLNKPKKQDIEMAENAMEQVGITHLRDKYCNQMSGGELQMVLIARALATDPKMLIMDEPESNLDFKNQLIVLNTISKLSREFNISAFINTHYPQHAIKISDTTIMLNRDRSQIYGKSNEVINNNNLKEIFDIEVAIEDVHIHKGVHRCIIPLANITN